LYIVELWRATLGCWIRATQQSRWQRVSGRIFGLRGTIVPRSGRSRFARVFVVVVASLSLSCARVPLSSSRWGATVISCRPRHLSLWSARHRSTCRMTCLRALPASSCAVCRMSRTIRAAPRSPSSPSSPARCSRSFAGAAAPFWACCSSTRCSRRAASITRTSRPCCGGCARCCARARPSTRARSRAASCARRDCCLRSAYGAARLW